MATKAQKYSYYRNQQAKAFAILGNACKHCGFTDERAFQIDHINGDAPEERKNMGHKATSGGSFGKTVSIYKKIIEGSTRYQLLCANCNWIKRVENNETRWRTT